MKKTAAATALALCSLVPALAPACEYDASTSASATPPTQLASTPAPAASRAPVSAPMTAPAAKPTAKQAVTKTREPAANATVAAVSIK